MEGEVGEGEVVLQRQLCGVGVGYVPETLSSRRPFALTRQQSREGWEAGWEPPWPWSVKAQKAVVLCGRVWTGASEKAGGGQAKEDAGWQGRVVGNRWEPWGLCPPPGHGSPERVALLEQGPEVMMGRSRPSSKNVPKGKFRSTGTVNEVKGNQWHNLQM